MFRLAKETLRIDKRTYKNFGHKRQPESSFTVLWHGFLTISFIGLGIEWRRLYGLFSKEDSETDDCNGKENDK